MPVPPISDVSDTAFMIAAQRAIESERPDALFHDPLAGRLAGEHGREIIASLAGTVLASSWSVAIRTCIVDAFILRAIAQGADTVLNLGAGLDTRPYRLQLPPALQWIEVDYPKVIAYKESILSGERPACRLERVSLDLADRPARQSLFAELGARSRHVLVLTEGVLPYLTMEDVAALADDLASRPGVRHWIVDYFSPATYEYRKRVAIKQLKHAPFRFWPADSSAFFAEHGWKAAEVRYLVDEGERLGRPMRLPFFLTLGFLLKALMTPRAKRGNYRTFAGFVLMEPVRAA